MSNVGLRYFTILFLVLIDKTKGQLENYRVHRAMQRDSPTESDEREMELKLSLEEAKSRSVPCFQCFLFSNRLACEP